MAATVNYATGTARVMAPAGLPTTDLIAAVVTAGYTATEATGYGDAAATQVRAAGAGGDEAPGDEAPGSLEAARHFADLRRRLIVALALFVPLTDFSLVLSLLPSMRFPGWQWVLIGCAAPVALWCAWPFHQAALRGARHGAATMDTLVSLGIVAACGWSGYAMFGLDHGVPAAVPLAAARARFRRRHLPGDRRHGHHVPAGRAAVRGTRPAHRRPGIRSLAAPRPGT